MKIIFFLFSFFALMIAQEVEITADKFSADEKKLLGEFVGNVKITKEQDKLIAKKVLINLNEKRIPIRYEATGNPEFNITINNKKYFGKGDVLVYEPEKNIYSIFGNAFLKEVDTNRKIYGKNIIIDQKKGSYNVDSEEKKPVKIIFKIEDKIKK